MSSAISDSGLASCLSNVFKLAEVEGLKWVRYIGPNSTTLETPKADPVLTSYARLLNEGLSPSTDGVSGEAKDLWIFYFTALPDLSGKISPELQEHGTVSTGSWEDTTSLTDCSAMLFRALNGLIERSLLNENFLPLGKWFARPDHSMGSNGRGCFLCNFSFFIHAHQFICASVDVRAGPALQPLLASHLYQALSSSSGMQVILSPSGLNGIMTGHSYQMTDPGIEDLINEWKLFYPNIFDSSDAPSNLPAAVEVVLGGVRLRYPSQFVFVYHTEDSFPTPPPSPIEEGMMERIIQGGWEETACVEPLLLQRECETCNCSEMLSKRDSHTNAPRPSRPHRLVSNTSGSGDTYKSERLSKHHRYKPYSTVPHPTDNATPMREQSIPSSLNLNTAMLGTHRKHLGPPKYTTPLPSPAVTIPSSPAIKPTLFPNPGLFPAPPSTTPPVLPNSGLKLYDMSRVSDIITSTSTDREMSYYNNRERGWWQYIDLPDGNFAIQKQVAPISPWATGFVPPVPLQTPHSPTALMNRKVIPSSIKKVRSNQSISSESQLPDLSSPSKRRPSISKGNRPPRSYRSSEVVAPATLLDQDEPLERTISIYDSTTGTCNCSDIMLLSSGGFMEGTAETGTSIKAPTGNLDLTSENAVKISGDLGNLFDDSEEEDDIQKVTTSLYEANHFSYSDGMSYSDMKLQSGLRSGTKVTKLISDQLHPSPDLSRIYPTPPSVESNDEKFDDGKQLMNSAILEEKNEFIESNLMTKLSPFDDVMFELIPDDFTALSSLTISNLPLQKKNSIYVSIPSNSNVSKTKFGKSATPSNLLGITSEPQKFIFPPPPSFVNRNLLSLPLAANRDQTISPLISTPFTSLPSGSPMRMPGRYSRHFPSSAQTPLESPFDPITPTPMSSSRLTPILPEAHALYVNLALLDSALAANVSDNVDIDFNAIQKFITKRSHWREHLDSVSSTAGVGSTSTSLGIGNGGDNDLLKLEEEKPLMMAEIADYPTLGFKEDIMANTPSLAPSWNQIGLSCLSEDASIASTQLFLSIVQDYCLHLCLTGSEEFTQTSSLSLASTPIALQQPFQKNQHINQQSKQMCRLYHTHSVSSAILCGKHLLSRSLPQKLPPTSSGTLKQLPPQPTLDKEDNSAAWVLDLLTLPTKFVTKKLRELRLVFQNSFHHAPCIKVSTKGPMTLRDLQTLTPSQLPIGDECVPLPMQPLIVGYDYDWMSVSPLTIPTWDKLLLEPYSMYKHILYLAICPGGDAITDTLSNFFQNISITYKSCRLGCHAPLDKGNWEKGIITSYVTKCEQEKDVKPNIKKETPSSLPPLSTFEHICKETLVQFFSKLPTDREGLLASTTHDLSSLGRSNTPFFVVVYVLMKNISGKTKSTTKQTQHSKVVEVMKTMATLLSNEEIPEETRNRILIQPLEESELLGPQANNTHRLRSLAFSVFSRCCPELLLTSDAHHLTGFGPISSRPQTAFNQAKLYTPLYVLSSDPPLISMPLSSNLASSQPSQASSILFSPDESTLFCSYCVSADKRWLLAVVCDRQAELLDTSVIGLTPNDFDGSSSGRYQPLERLWVYLISTISTSVLKWNIVITRFGKPSSAEIREWPRIIIQDGLMTANQLLKNECTYCTYSSFYPTIKNVIMVSVQPERNIQLFPTTDTCPSISHILVLPPHPNAVAAATPTLPEDDSIMNYFDAADSNIPFFDGISDDLFVGLNDMDFPNANITAIPGEDIRAPLATGYLISTVPPGHLPNEFWGHDKPQSVCHMFKTLLHWHLSVHTHPGNPPDVLCSVLLAFDALSWLSINHVTQQRNSSLPIHLFLLSKIYNFMTVLSNTR